MKRIIYLFFILVFSGIIISGTLNDYNNGKKDEMGKEIENFLSSTNKLFYYNQESLSFTEKQAETDIFYKSINPVDGIYYRAKKSNAFTIAKTPNLTSIKIDEGEYIFVLNDVFSKYSVIGKDFKINQLGKGIFYVNNIKDNIKIYSLNSLINITLISGNINIVNFDLFPSLLFKYNIGYNKDLKGADVLRISQVDDISFVDGKEENIVKKLYPDDMDNNLLKIAYGDLKSKISKFRNYYKEILKMNFTELLSYGLIKDYGDLFQNQTKKNIYYKNEIAKNFLEILKSESSEASKVNFTAINAKYIDSIQAALTASRQDDKLYEECVDIIKNYYYLSYFGDIIGEKLNIEGTLKNNKYNLLKSFFADKIAGQEHFSLLSDIFLSYDFTDIDEESLEQYIFSYVKNLQSNKILKDKDFLNFTFFLAQYSFANNRVSTNSINIILYLKDMFNNYYATINGKGEDFNKKRLSALDFHFFNLSRIILKISNNILQKHFEKNASGNLILKQEYYVTNGNSVDANIGKELTENIILLGKNGYSDLLDKKKDFDSLQKVGDSGNTAKSNYTILEEKYKTLSKIIDIIINYDSYYTKLDLNNKNRNADAQIYEGDDRVMDKSEIVSYLSQFEGLDMKTYLLVNEQTFLKDGYYDNEISIYDKKLYFKLYPEGHLIKGLVIESNGDKDLTNSGQVINLDSAKEKNEEITSKMTDENEKKKISFKRFFINAFFTKPSDDSGDNQNNDTAAAIQESKELSLFKQSKLIKGDFTYVNQFMNITFEKIEVSIENGEYKIRINKVPKSFTSNGFTFDTELTALYDFAEHSFSSITLQVEEEKLESGSKGDYKYDGNSILISPSKIYLKEFSKTLSNLGDYLSTLDSNYTDGASVIKFDLNLKRVYIDSKSYPVIFN